MMTMLLLAVMESAWADTVTFTAGTDKSEGTSITKNGITISFSNGVFDREDNYRCYANASMTISSVGLIISKIDFTATSSNPMTNFSDNPDEGSWSNDNKTQWTGNASVINFGVASAQVRITEIVVTVDNPISNDEWVLTNLTDLSSNDIFVIVGNNGTNYAMTNDKGTSTSPVAYEVIVSNVDNKIKNIVPDNLKWNISIDDNGYTFHPNGSTSTWLYCTNDNNGVRVGTGNAKHFILSDEGYLTTTETNSQRYLGIYNSNDWRCYTSINTNITGQTFAFYKKVFQTHTVTFSANGETFSSTIVEEGANIEFPPTKPADVSGYTFVGWSTDDWNGVVDDSPNTIITSATMGTEDMTIYAVYATAKVTGSRWKKVEENAVSEDGTYAILAYQTESPTEYYAFSGTISSAGHGMMTSEHISFDSDGYTISMPHGTCELTFENNGNGFVINNSEKGYLYANGITSGSLAWSVTQPEGFWKFANDGWQYSNGAYLRGYSGTSGTTIRTYGTKNNQSILFAQKVDKIRYSNYCTREVGNFEIVEFTTAGYKSNVTENAIDWTATLTRNNDNVDVHGYQVTEFSRYSVTLTELSGITTVANTPVILMGKEGKNLLVIASDEGSDISSTNLLKRGSERKESEKNFMYVLQKSKDWSKNNPYENYNFYPLRPDRWNEIGDRQAYLVLSSAPGGNDIGGNTGGPAMGIPMRFVNATDDDPMVSEDAGLVDGINDIQRNEAHDGEFYSISGVRVSAPTKGLYIVKGKKVLVK